MRAAVLLPAFGADLPYLAQWLHADRVYLDDTAPWSRKSLVHRMRLRGTHQPDYLRLPLPPHASGLPLARIPAPRGPEFIRDIRKKLDTDYRNHPYSDHYLPEFLHDLEPRREDVHLAGYLVRLMGRWWTYLELPFEPLLVSEHGYPDRARTAWQRDFDIPHPTYPQNRPDFEPDCGLWDLLFALGPESWRVTDALRP